MQNEHEAEFSGGSAQPRVRDPVSVMEELIGTEVLVDTDALQKAQEGDSFCQLLRQWIGDDNAVAPPGVGRLLKRSSFKLVEGVLYTIDLKGTSSNGQPRLNCVVPTSMRTDLVRAFHEGYGHPGIHRTLKVLQSRVWWPQTYADVSQVLSQCPTCLYNKETVYRGAQHIPPNGAHPWHSVQMDLVHMHKTRSGMEKVLVVYDRFTRDIECFAVSANCTSEHITNILFFEIVPRHGWPRVLYTDRGSNFISARAKAWFEKMGILLVPADAHMHTAVAGCERFNHTLREIARATHFDHGFEWDLILPLAVFWYKTLIQTSTGHSPFYMNHGREAVSPWDIRNGPVVVAPSADEYVKKQFASLHLAWQCTVADLKEREEAQKARHAPRYQTNVTFTKGERVLIRQAGRRSKMHMPYVGPFKIEEVLERDRYRVSGRRNAKRDHHEFHVSRLKLWPAGADDEEVYLSEDYFDVDKVVATKKGSDGAVLYRVRWQGYGATDDQWIQFQDMNGACARAALDFIQAQEGADADEQQDGADSEGSDAPAEESQNGAAVQSEPPQVPDGERQDDERARRLAARQERMGPARPGKELPRELR